MQSPAPASPNRETGLPPGVEVAPLGKRFVAYLIDISVPAVVSAVIGFVLPSTSGGLQLGLSVISGLVALGWTLFLWFRLASRAATPGMQVMKLQLVGFYDGRPIGLARVLIRGLILWLLSATGIGLVIMLILLVLHPRKQGWHDLAAKAVMIKERTLAPGQPAPPAAAVAAAPQGGPQQGYARRSRGTPPQQGYPQQQPAPQQYQPQYAPQQVPSQRYQPQPAPSATPLAPPPGYGPPAGFPGRPAATATDSAIGRRRPSARTSRSVLRSGAGTGVGAPRRLSRPRSRPRRLRRRPRSPAADVDGGAGRRPGDQHRRSGAARSQPAAPAG